MEGRVVLKGSIHRIPAIDKTLATEGDAADAKATGEAIQKVIDRKPVGEYVGNGEIVNVAVNGAGNVLMVYCESYMSIVTPKGALVFKLSDGSAKWADETSVYYANGLLCINALDDAFNEADVKYYYQVL